jgi:hypothetical protein
MGLLGDGLPSAEKATASAQSAASAASGFVQEKASALGNFVKSGVSDFSLASIPQKLGEGASKMLSSFGSLAGFANLAGGVKVNKITDALLKKGIAIPPGKRQGLTDRKETAMPRTSNADVIVMLESTISNESVKFIASPRVGESRQASYTEVNITHHPGSILKYDKTSSRSWTVGVRLISRTQQEASDNQKILNTVRAWVMPYYGAGTAKSSPELLGAPPPVLRFSGYGKKNISPVPVVLESYNTNWPNDIDYIPTLEGEPFPVIMELDLNLKESYSPAEYSSFDLAAYKTGNTKAAFSASNSVFEAKSPKTANDKVKTGEGPSILGGVKGTFGKALPTATSISSMTDMKIPGVNAGIPGLPAAPNLRALNPAASTESGGNFGLPSDTEAWKKQ